jgi:hypothetical protein
VLGGKRGRRPRDPANHVSTGSKSVGAARRLDGYLRTDGKKPGDFSVSRPMRRRRVHDNAAGT